MWRRKATASLLFGVLMLLGGCATHTTAPTKDWVAHGIRRVAPTSAVGFAEAAAAQADGDFVLVGMGDSMRPHYVRGTAIVVRPTSFFMLQPGMPVVYESRSGRRVAHVLVAKSTRGWQVQGTGNGSADRELVTPENLLGVVRYAFVPERGEGVEGRLAGM